MRRLPLVELAYDWSTPGISLCHPAPLNDANGELSVNFLLGRKLLTFAHHEEEPFELVLDAGLTGFQAGNLAPCQRTKTA